MTIASKSPTPEKPKCDRRGFFKGSLTALAGAFLARGRLSAARNIDPASQASTITRFRTLGRTGFKVSDIGFGTPELTEPALLAAGLDAGINYIDTAEGYQNGGSERAVGEVLKNRNRRGLFITTKLAVKPNETRKGIIDRVGRCLERLRTDYVDCLMLHMPYTREHLLNRNFHRAIRDLKSQGKVRFSGLAHHGTLWDDVPETMETIALAAAADGRFDVILFAYNFMQRERGDKILAACREKDMGVTLMKTNPVLNYRNMMKQMDDARAAGRKPPAWIERILPGLKQRMDEAEDFIREHRLDSPDRIRDAAVKFVLNQDAVHTACLTIKNFEELKTYLALSGKKLTPLEEDALVFYAGSLGGFYCRHACGECEAACPHGVPVNTILRYSHYYWAQDRERTAVLKYAALPAPHAGRCLSCSGPCEQACPYGVPGRGLLTLAHRTLSLS